MVSIHMTGTIGVHIPQGVRVVPVDMQRPLYGHLEDGPQGFREKETL